MIDSVLGSSVRNSVRSAQRSVPRERDYRQRRFVCTPSCGRSLIYGRARKRSGLGAEMRYAMNWKRWLWIAEIEVGVLVFRLRMATKRSNVLISKSGYTSIWRPPAAPRPAHNSVRAASAISWPPTPPALNDRPKRLAYAFSSSAVSLDDDPVC